MDTDDRDSILDALPGIRAAVGGLRHADGKHDGAALTDLFGLSSEDLLKTCAIAGSDADRILHSLERCAYLLVLNPDPENFRRWLATPNIEFGGTSPIGMIRSGRPDVVAHLVADVLTNRGG